LIKSFASRREASPACARYFSNRSNPGARVLSNIFRVVWILPLFVVVLILVRMLLRISCFVFLGRLEDLRREMRFDWFFINVMGPRAVLPLESFERDDFIVKL
jgi:hypothetical protein